jgi:hypothetical protein
MGTIFLVCVCPISRGLFVASSSRQTFIFSQSHVLSVHGNAYSAMTYSPDYELFFGVTAGIPALHLFHPDAPSDILANYGLNQGYVHQIHVAPLSNAVVTAGGDIRVWTFHFSMKTRTIRIRMRSSFPSSPFCSGMHNVFIDEGRERVIVPTQCGFKIWSFDGRLLLANTRGLRGSMRPSSAHSGRSWRPTRPGASAFGSRPVR